MLEKNNKRNNEVVTVLGSGTCVPSLKRSSCSLLLSVGDRNILFDAGMGTITRLLQAGKKITDLSAVVLSHFHPDHTSEIVPLLFALKNDKPLPGKKPLKIISGKGFSDFYNNLRGVYGDWITLPEGELEFIELETDFTESIVLEGCRLTGAHVNHRPESLAYRVETPSGSIFVYSGDTDYSENLITISKGADLFVCESAHPDELKVDGHLAPSLAGKIATEAGVKKLLLTHFYPECDKVDIAKQCRNTYIGPLLIAEDLMVIDINNIG